MDGRIQESIRRWTAETTGAQYVDTITYPGVDRLVAENTDAARIRAMIAISTGAHGSDTVVISGHHDCAGNPVTKAEHLKHIQSSVNVIKSWYPQVEVVGVWVNDLWQVEPLS